MGQQTAVAPSPPGTADGGAALFAWLRRMRDKAPVWRDPRGCYHVFRYDDVRRVLTDLETFSSDHGRFMSGGDVFSRGNLTTMDPPPHRKLRQLVNQAFTPAIVAGLAPRIAAIAGDLIARFPGGQFDLIEHFARPLPVIVIADLLGVPAADRELFHRWVDGLLAIQAGELANAEVGQAVQAAMAGLHEYMLARCHERRDRPRDDLISQLAGAEVDGDRLADDEVATLCTLLLLAGHITTTMLLGNAVLCLDKDRAAAAELRADRALIPGAIEEVLRYRASFIQAGRFATKQARIGDMPIPEGAYVSGWILSANHDERQFAEPERFDIHRAPNRHLAFGHGIHFCLGAQLARLEGKIALELLLDGCAELAPAPGPEIVYFQDGTTFGAKRLPVTATRQRGKGPGDA